MRRELGVLCDTLVEVKTLGPGAGVRRELPGVGTLIELEVLFAEAVLEDVLGLGREKPVAEPPLRNELVEVADPCTPTVPDVDVSSSKLYFACLTADI